MACFAPLEDGAMGVGWVPFCTTLVEGGEILHGGGSLERFCGCDGAGNNCH